MLTDRLAVHAGIPCRGFDPVEAERLMLEAFSELDSEVGVTVVRYCKHRA